MSDKIFSEFEVKDMAFKSAGEASASPVGCVGSLEEELGVKTITKKCEGVVIKTITKSDGTGTVKISAHIRANVYNEMFGFNNDGLKDGVYGYGNKVHAQGTLTARVLDEDGNVKYKAYPNAVASAGPARKIENGADEVAEVEIELALSADENNRVVYDAYEDEIKEESLKTQWLTNFTPELIKKVG